MEYFLDCFLWKWTIACPKTDALSYLRDVFRVDINDFRAFSKTVPFVEDETERKREGGKLKNIFFLYRLFIIIKYGSYM